MLRKSSLMALALAGAMFAQNAPLMNGRETLALEERLLQLMESVAMTIPELHRAAAPLMENAKQARLNQAQAAGQQHAGYVYTFLRNARAYAALTSAMPRPFPYLEEAKKQIAELQEGVQRLDTHFIALLDQREGALRPADRDNLRRYLDANLKTPPPAPGKPRVVFFGDSITDGWRINEYFPGQDYVNRGISGQVTGEMLGRMKADVIDLKPAAMLILGGTNDLARGTQLATIQNNLAMIADLCVQNKIKPIFASVLPVSDYHKDKNPAYEMTKRRPPDQIKALNAWLKSFCQNRGFTYLDYFTALADGGGMLKAEVADDGLHPNAAGYRLMAPLAADAIQRALGSGAANAGGRKRQ